MFLDATSLLIVWHVSGWPPEPGYLPITIRGVKIRRYIWPPGPVAHVWVETPWTELLHARHISPLSQNLQLPAMQFGFIQKKSLLNSLYFKKLHISKTFWLTKLISQNSYPVHRTAWLEMLLHFLWGACIIDLQAENWFPWFPGQNKWAAIMSRN